jgi:hypothetical protein
VSDTIPSAKIAIVGSKGLTTRKDLESAVACAKEMSIESINMKILLHKILVLALYFLLCKFKPIVWNRIKKETGYIFSICIIKI